MKIILEYIWIGGQEELRSKTKVMEVVEASENSVQAMDTYTDPTHRQETIKRFEPRLEQIPVWNYDGSSTFQATTENSEILLRPQRLFRDPFRRHVQESPSNHHQDFVPSFLVICDTYLPNGIPHPTNTRFRAAQVFEQGDRLGLAPLFGIEQEFFMVDIKTLRPLGFPKDLSSYPEKQGHYYCSTGAGRVFGREIMEEAFQNCIYAGISLTGMNFEVAPGQCELQVCEYGIGAGDHLVMCRYILERTLERYSLRLDLSAKPVKGDWNGSGCHVNFSTEPMRSEGGLEIIKQAIDKLSLKHQEHLTIYGDGNHERLTGHHETSSLTNFTWGVANRGASIRIPQETACNGCGYLEDRRPAASIDPYMVTAIILETTSL